MQIHPAYVAGLADSDGSFTITIRHKNRSKPEKLTKFHHGLYLKMRELNSKNSGDRSKCK